MKFYIVTPCLNALHRLRCCVRSVADQVGDGIEVHHHVQDAASTDGTPEWLAQWQQEHLAPGYTFTYASAPDAGMYDAINKAWERMPQNADVTAHLNADEQYLPQVLKSVAAAFAVRSEADIIEGTYIITDSEGNYVCHRRPVTPHRWVSMRNCEMITCATFHKAETFRNHGIRFDTRFRVYGDVIFFRNIVCAGIRIVTQPRLIAATFAITGQNMAWAHIGGEEAQLLDSLTPPLYLKLAPLACKYSNALRYGADLSLPAPRSYAIYRSRETTRTSINITSPTARWGFSAPNLQH